MDEYNVREILGDTIQANKSLFNLGHYICWNVGEESITLDDDFSLDELEAIVWWTKNTNKKRGGEER